MFKQMYSESILSDLRTQGQAIDRMSNSKFGFIDSIKPIPDFPELHKYINLFAGIDLQKINELLYNHFTLQLNAISQTCIERFQLTSDNLKQVELIIMDHIGQDKYNEIAEEVTDYKLFHQGIHRIFAVVGVIALIAKSVVLFTLSALSYATYVYTLMIKKYMRFCKADIFNVAVSNAHGNNLIASNYKKGGHIAVIEYVTVAEINKFLQNKHFTKLKYTRMFTYIKSRFNQGLRHFFNSTYYKYYKEYKETISKAQNAGTSQYGTAQIGVIVDEILHNHKMLTEVPRTHVETISELLGLEPALSMDFAKKFIELNKYGKLEPLLKKFYTLLFTHVRFNSTEDVCRNMYFRDTLSFVFSKTEFGNETRAYLRKIVDMIFKELNISKGDTVKRLYTKYLFYILFIIYIKGTLCK